MDYGRALTPASYFAWQKSVEIGTKLAEDHPEIRGWYRGGEKWTLERIAAELDVQANYGASKRVAITAVGHALNSLIPSQNERIRLRILHHQAGAEKRYTLHGSSFTKEDCETGAANLYGSLTFEEKRAKSLSAIVAQGKTPWTEEEVEAFRRMCSQSGYLIMTGRNSGLPDMAKIAEAINAQFHAGKNVRARKALSTLKRKRHF